MNRAATFIRYDLFKLIVALILLVLWILLMLRPPQLIAPQAALPAEASQTPAALAEPTQTLTPEAAATANPEADPTETPTPAEAPAPTATPDAASTPEETDTPEAAAETLLVDCPLAMPSRLEVGDTVRAVSNLNQRASPDAQGRLILTNPAGTQLQVIGGPVCQPYQAGAYLWWELQRPDGQTGWSAEGWLNGGAYFLEPVD